MSDAKLVKSSESCARCGEKGGIGERVEGEWRLNVVRMGSEWGVNVGRKNIFLLKKFGRNEKVRIFAPAKRS